MFGSPESTRMDKVSKSEFDRANDVIVESWRRLDEDNDYQMYSVDLSTIHTNTSLGLRADGLLVDSFTVHSAPSPATLRINNPSAGAITAIQGLRREGIIKEIYVTNSAAYGTLQIEVSWKYKDRLKVDEVAYKDTAEKEKVEKNEKKEGISVKAKKKDMRGRGGA